MIKINLCPIDELESQYWYVPDLAVAMAVAIAAFFGVQYYLGTIQEEIDTATEKVASLEASTKQLEPDLKRFETLDADIKELNTKLSALQAITVSKISKYKPVIVLEHLQSLKPLGVWYQMIKIGTDDPDGFEVKGQGFDNILTAELMTAMRSTESQEVDQADLRTQVFFNELLLVDTMLPKTPPKGFPELAKFPEFQIRGKYKERGDDPKKTEADETAVMKVSKADQTDDEETL